MNHELNGKTFLITGASGFIGSNLVRKIKEEGGKPVSLIRSSTNDSKVKLLEKHALIKVVDLLDYNQVKEVIVNINPDYIIHTAQPPAPKNPIEYSEALLSSTKNLLNLLQAILDTDTAIRFVHTCSSMIYRWTPSEYSLKEDTPFAPTSLRGMLKLNERNICHYFYNQYDLDIRLARIFRAYGPCDSNRKLIMKVIESLDRDLEIAIGSNDYKRDYLHIDDLCNGILKLTTLNTGRWHEVNFGSGECYGPEDIVAFIERITGKRIKRSQVGYNQNMFDLGQIEANIEHARHLIDWKPLMSIEDGLKRTIEWYSREKK